MLNYSFQPVHNYLLV